MNSDLGYHLFFLWKARVFHSSRCSRLCREIDVLVLFIFRASLLQCGFLCRDVLDLWHQL